MPGPAAVGPPSTVQAPLPIADLAFAAERDLGAIGEIMSTEAMTRQTLSMVNGFLIRSGLARGLPTNTAEGDAEACFHNAAAGLGLQIAHIAVKLPNTPLPPPKRLRPGEHWQPQAAELLGTLEMSVQVNGPLPLVARMVDLVGKCPRLVLIEQAKVEGSRVYMQALAWYERPIPAPELELKWRSADDRLAAAGWKLNDPALAKDPAMPRLRSAVDAGREQLPAVRALLKTTLELPRYMARARELVQIRAQVSRVVGRRILGLEG